MSKKIQHKRLSEKTHKSGAPGVAQFIKPLGVVILVLFLSCALIYLFAPSSKLEPYDKFKGTKEAAKESKESKSKENPLPPKPTSSEESSADQRKPPIKTVADTGEKNAADLVKKAVDMAPPAPKSNLPRETLEHIAKGMQMSEKGKFELAELEFEKAAELSPDSPEVFSIWGAALRMQKKYKGANAKFERALKLAPNDEEIIFNWGMSRLEERDPNGAIDLFQKTIKANPRHYLAYNYLGKALGQKKEYDKEIEAYRKALEINPDFAQTHFNLGVILSIRNKVNEAAPYFERAIELDKEFEQPFVVQMLTALGRYNKPKDKSQAGDKPKTGTEQTAEHDPNAHAPKDEPKKSEGSDHKMEGSSDKAEKDSTTIKGRVLVNGEPIGSNAVVFLEAKNKLKVGGQSVRDVTVKQRNLQFQPGQSVVYAGATVTFANEDQEVHNIYSKSTNNQFNLGAMAAGLSKSVKLMEPGPVVLRCNMHKDMVGVIFVAPNGYYVHPNKNGEYKLENVANLEYILQVWHPRLYPAEIEQNMKTLKLNGADQVLDFSITSASKPDEIHDMVENKDYKVVADEIEKEILLAIDDWKAGKNYIAAKRMLIAMTKYYEGEGLKGDISKSFSEKRSQALEDKMDAIRKKISGIGPYKNEKFTKESLQSEAKLAVDQLRENIRELESRINPAWDKEKPEAKN